MRRRGQAALEFLTTYGWAFLVILVMIGALAYFGVLDPSRFVPQRCQFGAPLVCDGENYIIGDGGGLAENVTFRLRNTLNTDYQVTAVQVRLSDGSWSLNCLSGGPVTVPVDGAAAVVCDLNPVVTAGTIDWGSVGQKQRLPMQITYDNGDVNFAKTLPGEVYANILT